MPMTVLNGTQLPYSDATGAREMATNVPKRRTAGSHSITSIRWVARNPGASIRAR